MPSSRSRVVPIGIRPPLLRVQTLRLIAFTATFAACMLSLRPSQALAFATIDTQQIVVYGLAARTVIERTPFRMSFTDAQGRVVVRQVENTRPQPVAIPYTVDPAPLGDQSSPGVYLNSPLFFEVGGQGVFTYVSSVENPNPWVGNLYQAVRQGGIYAATDVISAERVGQGVRVVVGTNDPQGRQLIVTVEPDGVNAMRVRATLSFTAGVMNIGDAFVARSDEAFHGFGGRHPSTNLRGRRFYSWTEQENLGGGLIELQAAQTLGPELAREYMYPNGPMAAYYPLNSFVTSRPGADAQGKDLAYGMLVANPELTRWRLDSDEGPDAYQFSVSTTMLDYTVAVGQTVDLPVLSAITPESQVIAALTRISGRHRVAPEWSQGPTISRTVKTADLTTGQGADTPETYKQKILDDLAQIESNHLPVTAYAFEGFAVLEPEFVQQVILTLRQRGIRSLLYARPFFSNDGLLTEGPNDFGEVIGRGLVTKTATGEPYIWVYRAPAALLDLTLPAAIDWYQDRLRALLDLGADGFMLDFGEQVTNDMVFANGQTGVTMHNQYPILQTQIARELTDAYEAAHPERGPLFFFTRSGYSGRPGSTYDEMSNFPGDETTDWAKSSGIASLAPDMLNRAIGGAYGFNTDIGGYADFVTTPTSKELFIRWSQFAALTPFFRVHNSSINGVRQPWSFDADTLAAWREAAELHIAAIPLMQRLWNTAQETGMPITRPLWLAFPDDVEAAKQDQQWMLGDNVLVAPVVTEAAVTRDVYFPKGCWRDANTGEVIRGPRTKTVEAPLEWLPHFTRCFTNPL